MGPKIEPWETPDDTWTKEAVGLIQIVWEQSVKRNDNQTVW